MGAHVNTCAPALSVIITNHILSLHPQKGFFVGGGGQLTSLVCVNQLVGHRQLTRSGVIVKYRSINKNFNSLPHCTFKIPISLSLYSLPSTV